MCHYVFESAGESFQSRFCECHGGVCPVTSIRILIGRLADSMVVRLDVSGCSQLYRFLLLGVEFSAGLLIFTS